jgi:hypothetical protein
MFEIDNETATIEKEWTDTKNIDQELRSKAIKELNNFIYIWERYKTVSGEKQFISGDYRVYSLLEDGYKFMDIDYNYTKMFKKQHKCILRAYYDFTGLVKPSQVVNPDFPYSVLNLEYYDPKKNDIYTRIFNELKIQYQQAMEANTNLLRVDSAYLELSLNQCFN